MMTVKLTYAEYKKASEAGFCSGHACACMGPQDDDEWCPCSMNVLEKIVPEDRHLIEKDWKANGRLSRSDQEAIWDAERGVQNEYYKKIREKTKAKEKAGWAQMEKALQEKCAEDSLDSFWKQFNDG